MALRPAPVTVTSGGGSMRTMGQIDEQGNFYNKEGVPLNSRNGTFTADQFSGKSPTATGNAQDLIQLERERERIRNSDSNKQRLQGLNPDGSPIRPDFTGITGGDNMLQEKYKLYGGADVSADQRATDAIRARGLSQGPSEWAKMMEGKQALEQTNQMDQSRQQSNGAQAQTLAALMMRGGLGGGSRERVARSTLRDQMLASQQVNRQGQLDRSNIGIQDEATKNDMLKTTAGLDFQNANLGIQNRNYTTDIQKTNLMNTLSGLDAKNKFGMDTYSEQMKKWAAGKQADAQASASGGGKK